MKHHPAEEQASIFCNILDLKGQLFTLYLQYFFLSYTWTILKYGFVFLNTDLWMQLWLVY